MTGSARIQSRGIEATVAGRKIRKRRILRQANVAIVVPQVANKICQQHLGWIQFPGQCISSIITHQLQYSETASNWVNCPGTVIIIEMYCLKDAIIENCCRGTVQISLVTGWQIVPWRGHASHPKDELVETGGDEGEFLFPCPSTLSYLLSFYSGLWRYGQEPNSCIEHAPTFVHPAPNSGHIIQNVARNVEKHVLSSLEIQLKSLFTGLLAYLVISTEQETAINMFIIMRPSSLGGAA